VGSRHQEQNCEGGKAQSGQYMARLSRAVTLVFKKFHKANDLLFKKLEKSSAYCLSSFTSGGQLLKVTCCCLSSFPSREGQHFEKLNWNLTSLTTYVDR
jgi:hypothetical protein